MASVTLDVDVNKAIKGLEGEVSELLKKADRKFAVAETRMVAYAKAAAPVDTGFHRRNINKGASRPFLTASMFAAAEYASVLELGFFGLVGVEAHTRTITQAFGREIPAQTITVGNHVRPMDRPARPHIVPAAERALKQLIGDLEGLKV